MVGKKIAHNEGVTHEVFKEPEPKSPTEETAPLETVQSEAILQTISDLQEPEKPLP